VMIAMMTEKHVHMFSLRTLSTIMLLLAMLS
jgi:hypothetical protein